MAIYSISYGSMTAHYGPSIIEADSEDEARNKFGNGAFSQRERCLISARKISTREMASALREQNRRTED